MTSRWGMCWALGPPEWFGEECGGGFPAHLPRSRARSILALLFPASAALRFCQYFIPSNSLVESNLSGPHRC